MKTPPTITTLRYDGALLADDDDEETTRDASVRREPATEFRDRLRHVESTGFVEDGFEIMAVVPGRRGGTLYVERSRLGGTALRFQGPYDINRRRVIIDPHQLRAVVEALITELERDSRAARPERRRVR